MSEIRDNRRIRYCTKCGHVGEPQIEEDKNFSFLFFLFLCFLMLLPGLIYLALSRRNESFYVCEKCRGRLCLVSIDSPVAQAALPADDPAGIRVPVFCRDCGKYSEFGAKFCMSCGHAIASA